MKTNFSIVLYNPQIHWNTGAIGRSCVALGAELILIHPIGFSLGQKEIRRAGLDYWQHVKLSEYDDWQSFMEQRAPKAEDMYFLSAHVKAPYFQADFKEGGYLVFGSETDGLPDKFFEEHKERFYTVPMLGEEIRSLNLANTATAVAYEALRQIKSF